MELPELFKTCDVVVICCALTPETEGMITPELLRLLPKDAVFVNTARGEIIDEKGLLSVMDDRPDIRVALDVLVGETTGTQNAQPFVDRRAIITPHIAGETYESRTKAAQIIYALIMKELGNE
jgi:phosphoglycerate dehydrogenase-like enzyme